MDILYTLHPPGGEKKIDVLIDLDSPGGEKTSVTSLILADRLEGCTDVNSRV